MGHQHTDMTPETGRQPRDTQVFSGTGESPDHSRKALPRFDSPKRDDPQVVTIAPHVHAQSEREFGVDAPSPDFYQTSAHLGGLSR
jgi:hypothetical protein